MAETSNPRAVINALFVAGATVLLGLIARLEFGSGVAWSSVWLVIVPFSMRDTVAVLTLSPVSAANREARTAVRKS
jgi:hypothetical protein